MFSPHPVRRVPSARRFELDVDDEFKAKNIKVHSVRRPHMRSFHFAWLSFFLAFTGWFALAPLMPMVTVSMGLCENGGWDVITDPRDCDCGLACQQSLGTANMVSVAGTILMRIVIGAWVEMYGPCFCQTFLLCTFCIPLAMCGLAQTIEGLATARFFIGGIGATFVITQYWTSVMFAPNIIGTATATTAGWGNLGGGFTQVFMPWVLSWFAAAGPDQAWRLAVLVPAFLLFVTGVSMYMLADDVPQGSFKELYSSGNREKNKGYVALLVAVKDPRVWLLAMIYGGCFGTELTMNNMLFSYFYYYFGLSLQTAGLAAALFGLMNIFARSLGGVLSDVVAKHYGMRGRMWVLFCALLSEGLMLLAFSYVNNSQFNLALIVLLFFSTFVQMAEGAEFATVPFIGRYKKALGPIGGIVGSGGNVFAIIFGYIYRAYPVKAAVSGGAEYDPRTPFFIHSLIVLGIAMAVPFVHYNIYGSLFLPATKQAKVAPAPLPPPLGSPAHGPTAEAAMESAPKDGAASVAASGTVAQNRAHQADDDGNDDADAADRDAPAAPAAEAAMGSNAITLMPPVPR